jgi:hypothetical protein
MGFAGKSVFENGEEVEHDEWEMEPEEDYDE